MTLERVRQLPGWVTGLALGLLAVGLVFLALTGTLRPITAAATRPWVRVQTWVVRYVQAARDFLTAPREMDALIRRNRELEAQVQTLKAQVATLQQEVAQLEAVAQLLNFAREHPENKYLVAQVIGRDPSPFMHYILINVGSEDGVRPGMPVVAAEGLVGQVEAVIPTAARVRLITDPTSRVNVRTSPSNVDGVVAGSVTGDLSLTMVPLDAKIAPGDLVVTSGLGGQYPPNILVGQVVSTRRAGYALFQEAALQPAVDFAHIRAVMVITSFRAVDIRPLIPTPGAAGP